MELSGQNMKTGQRPHRYIAGRVRCSISFGLFILFGRYFDHTALAQHTVTPQVSRTLYSQVFMDDLESSSVRPGLIVQPPAAITHAAGETLYGQGSIKLVPGGRISTDPAVLPLKGNTYYAVQFDYRILDYGTSPDQITFIFFAPVNSTDPKTLLVPLQISRKAESSGTFSTGSLLGGADNYALQIVTAGNAIIVADNIRIIRNDPIPMVAQPSQWEHLTSAPFPRLAKVIQPTTNLLSVSGFGSVPPYTYTVRQIENNAAFADVIGNWSLGNQTADPDFGRRMRMLNPNVVILPGTLSQEIFSTVSTPLFANTNIQDEFRQSIPDDCIVKDSSGKPAADRSYAAVLKLNFSEFCPVIAGNTFNDALVDYGMRGVNSGLWDGLFFDNLFAHINSNIPNYNVADLLDFDINRNGQRDETPAYVSDLTRAAATRSMKMVRDRVGDNALLIGNDGSFPETSLASLMNGSYFECVGDFIWGTASKHSEANWRKAVDDYFMMQSTSRMPRINVIEGCGRYFGTSGEYLTPTPQDLMAHRFILATTLLNDGFYAYDLRDSGSPPYWFDEYSVNADGRAVEDLQYKGYLGAALGNAVELASPESVIWTEDFESSTIPASLISGPGISISHNPSEIIDGQGSLVIENASHASSSSVYVFTRTDQVPLSPGATYLVQFDWRVLASMDTPMYTAILGDPTVPAGYLPQGVNIVAGDSGHARFPVTLSAGSNLQLQIGWAGGAGKVAIDNLRISRGGTGPWRRDFENGFVLVNPINQPYEFSAEELAGVLNRTGIKRIKGTQSPDANSGQAVTGSLILQPFDAILLLADHIDADIRKSAVPFAVFSGAQVVTAKNSSSQVDTGYGRIQPDAATVSPSGLAIFGYRQNGVLVTEASVSASSTVQSGRLFAEIGGSINTGVAMANPNAQPAHVSFYFTDQDGNDFGAGSATLAAKARLPHFLTSLRFPEVLR